MRTKPIIKESIKAIVIAGSIIGAGLYFVPLNSTSSWTYDDASGPLYWGELDPTFHLCSDGKNQSPVNIKNTFDVHLPDIRFNYFPGATQIKLDNHSIQLNYTSPSQILFNDQPFELKHFRFHTPSEHQINHQSYPMEIHFVHQNKQKEYLVIAVFVEQGKVHAPLKKVWENIPSLGKTITLDNALNAFDFMPESKEYFKINGSLTAPPCSEGVTWLVLKKPIEASTSQINQLTKRFPKGNSRPIMPLNARVILEK